ncbi:MAG: sugar phosphate isomerase/epimerase family protein [Planctomycetia bacterium]|nr:sugar phosphate isomerase/epimerase family protein [Planctomycetia bacterium]
MKEHEVTDAKFDGKSANQSAKANLRICSRMEVIPGKDLEEKFAKMKSWGIEGAEVNVPLYGREDEIRMALANAGLVAAMTNFGVNPGNIISPNPEQRQLGIDSMKRKLEAAGRVGCAGMLYVPLFGAPKDGETNQSIRARLVDVLHPLAEFALEHKTCIVFEPLNRRESTFLCRVSDGAAICRDINSDGMKVMGDFYHMSIEETDMMGAFISGGKYLAHVHLAGGLSDPVRSIPGQNKSRYVEGFRGLKYIGYNAYCSFECGVRGDREIEIPKAITFLKREWELAVV